MLSIVIGLVIGAVTLGLGFGYYAADFDQWQTVMFTTIAFMQVGQAFGVGIGHDLCIVQGDSRCLYLGVAADDLHVQVFHHLFKLCRGVPVELPVGVSGKFGVDIAHLGNFLQCARHIRVHGVS